MAKLCKSKFAAAKNRGKVAFAPPCRGCILKFKIN